MRPAGVGADPGDRHLRHLVQLRAVAVQHARLARRDARPPALLPDQRHGDRVRDPLLLGRADDDARPLPDRCRAVPHGLPARDRPRPDGREDEQDEGQRRRPARDDRRRSAPMRCASRSSPATRPASTSASPQAKLDRRPELHEQAVERRSLRPRQRARSRWPSRPPTPIARRAMDPLAARRRRPSGRPGSSTTSTSPATRRRSTRWPGATTATGSSRWPRSTCDATDATDADRAATWLAAADGLATLLRLLHPLMPFVTEEIWQALGDVEPRATAGEPLLIAPAWPTAAASDPEAEAAFADLSTLVREVRNLRTAAGTPAGAWVPLIVEAADAGAGDALDAGRAYLEALAHVRPIERRTDGERPALVAATPLGAAWLGEDSATSATLDRAASREGRGAGGEHRAAADAAGATRRSCPGRPPRSWTGARAPRRARGAASPARPSDERVARSGHGGRGRGWLVESPRRSAQGLPQHVVPPAQEA